MADDGQWGVNGERLQSWVRRTVDVRGRTRAEGSTRPELGLVIARYYKDEDGNKSGQQTEYDVWVPRFQVRLNNLAVVSPYTGVSGGTQITLKPADGIPDMEDTYAIHQNIMDSDGDLVMIQYIGGTHPVITGCVNHLRTNQDGMSWETDSTDGEVSSHYYNTTRTRINSDGNIEVDLEDPDDDYDRSVIINVKGVQFMKISQDSGSGDVRIELGDGGQKVILGEDFATWWDYNVPHAHVLGGSTESGGSPAHTHDIRSVLLATISNEIPSFDTDNLTEKVKVEK